MNTYIDISKDTFKGEVIESPLPVLLDFWAPWCGPCKIVGPIIEQLAQDYSGRVKVGKINVDEEEDLAGTHGIVSVPTLVMYKDGEIVNQAVGALPKHSIEALFKDLL